MEKLSKRLLAIAEMVPNSIVADIGSDHGKLMIELFNSGKIVKGYAVENKKGPYNRLVKSLEKEGVIDSVVPIFSDGITDLPPSVTTVVIAGMGGKTIVEILKKHQSKLKNVDTLILDAHSCIPFLRDEVTKMGYAISDERIIKEDDVFYEIIKFIKADIAFYSSDDIEFGPILRKEKNTLFKEKYKNRIDKIDQIMHDNQLPYTKVDCLLKEKKKLESIL